MSSYISYCFSRPQAGAERHERAGLSPAKARELTIAMLAALENALAEANGAA